MARIYPPGELMFVVTARTGGALVEPHAVRHRIARPGPRIPGSSLRWHLFQHEDATFGASW